MIKWLFLLLIDFFLFAYVSFKYSFVFFVILFLYYVYESGIFRGITFQKILFTNHEIFYIEYVGDYAEIYSKELSKFKLLIKKFNLNRSNYAQFGIFYDDPIKVDPKKCRAVIGIIKEYRPDSKMSNKEEDFVEYLIKDNFKKAFLPETQCIHSFFEISDPLSMTLGIKKFDSTLDSHLQSEKFKNEFNIDRKKFKMSLEVYREKSVSFYVPTHNFDKFNLHSKKD